MLPIESVEATPLRVPLERPISSALGSYDHVDMTVVQIQTRDGPAGVGFNAGLGGASAPAVAAYLEAELAPLALGQDALAPEALWHRLWASNKPRLRAGLGMWALSAIDIACWDIVGRAAGLPLHSLLGGYTRSVPVYGSGGWHDFDDSELVAECSSFAELGVRAYKYKVGGPRDRERTRALRQAMGDDFGLLADANQKFGVRGAIEVARMLADFGVGWLEEPVPADSTDDLAAVAAASPVPIAAGENVYTRWGFREICDRRAASFLQPDATRCGGVTEFQKVAALAAAHNLALSSHLWHELSISLVGASSAGWMVEFAPLLPSGTFTREFGVEGGAINVSDAPGHGVELTPEARDRFRM